MSCALSNGNYLVTSFLADINGVANAGALTWGNGTTGGTIGVISSANSLVGNTADDDVGGFDITALDNGDYISVSPRLG